jgi:hypothetical protein
MKDDEVKNMVDEMTIGAIKLAIRSHDNGQKTTDVSLVHIIRILSHSGYE